MGRHHRTATLLACTVLGAAHAVTLRLYPDFTEVRAAARAPNGAITVSFPPGVAPHVIPGSLDLESVRVLSMTTRKVPSWLRTQEGRTVWWARAGKDTPVTLVSAEDLVVRDAQGRYRTVSLRDLSFGGRPPANPQARDTQYTFRVQGQNATLSYLTRGVRWSARYTLRASGKTATLTGLADLRNATTQALKVDAGAELFAGAVQLRSQAGDLPYPTPTTAGSTSEGSTPAVVSVGSLRGLQRYTLPQAFTLPAEATLTLPFLNPAVTLSRYSALNIPFSATSSDGNLQRAYRMRADAFLPGGALTVRDENRIVGQTRLGDTPPNRAVDLKLGADPDVTYTRTVKVIARDRASSTYRVTLTARNRRASPTRLDVREYLPAGGQVSGEAQQTASGLQVQAPVPARGSVTRTYTVETR
ncbi:hypothetical protein [Deinococcus maricopensis]|nr:hypothetical protein [Deinococcus maricopensis]